jgi:hypothetical protein
VKDVRVMRSKKRYTNATFTKRVDHEAGRHRTPRAGEEPQVCEECGAVYADRRWTLAGVGRGDIKHATWRPAQKTVCPACKQKRAGVPGGFVHLSGAFFVGHRGEIEKLLLNEAGRVTEDNPLARIINWGREESDCLTVTTTTEHLAQRLGHALEKAYDGETSYDFSHENKLGRVSWRRD